MPELPEVETVVRDLRPLLVGKTFAGVRRTSAQALRRPWDDTWNPVLTGNTVNALQRRGKWIILVLGDDRHLLVHLGMTGQLTVMPASTELADHTHLVWDLQGSQEQLRFRDIRRFGCAIVVNTRADLDAFFQEQGMGPEPFDLEPKAWRSAMAATARVIKAVLLDQTVVAGVGNIYADEALFQARLHPERRAQDLTTPEKDRLRKAIQTVLERAIEQRGSTIRNYVGGSGLKGGFQDEFKVYGRTDQPCPRCQVPIACVRLAGRSSHFCPQCQRLADEPVREERVEA